MKQASSQNSLIELARRTSQFIGGEFQAGGGTSFTVQDPSTEETVADIGGVSTDQVAAAVAAARRAADPWGGTSSTERISILRRFASELRHETDDLREVLIAEAGCVAGANPAAQAILAFQTVFPVHQAGEILDLYSKLPETRDNPVPLQQRVTPQGKQFQSILRYTPIGVVAAIAAYNYPFLTALWKVFPALVTGNPVILRPSPLTPISALVFARAAVRAELPKGVLSVIMEGGLEGARLLTTHPHVDMVAFTGSTTVGKQVMSQASAAMKRLQLELGGKSAQIFLPDALDQAAAQAAGVCLAHAGQGCVLGTRILVPQDKKAEVLSAMKAALENIPIGEARDPGTVLGPLISAAQVARCEHFVAASVAAGGRVVVGGKRPPQRKRGFFYEPTVLDVRNNDNPAAREEIFGPVVCVIGYRDIEHAIETANDSDYGLSGYVFGQDKAKCLQVALRLKTGTVNINGAGMSSYVSGGGHRQSGVGRERGEEGLRLYQEITCVNITA